MSGIENVSSVVGDLATAIAMAFAGYQLWLLNRQARIESHRNLIQSEREIWFKALEMSALTTTVVEEVWGVSDKKNAQANVLWGGFLDNCEHMYMRYEAGVMSKSDWASMESYIGRLIQAPSFKAAWKDIGSDYTSDFAAYVEDRLRSASSVGAGEEGGAACA